MNLSLRKAWLIAEDLKKSRENLEKHLEYLEDRSVEAETLHESNLEHVLAKFVNDEEFGVEVRAVLMEYCHVSSVAQKEHDTQMEKLREIRDNLYPARPPRDVDAVFKRVKWTPLPYDRSENHINKLANEIPRAVVAPKLEKGTKRKATDDVIQVTRKFANLAIEERPMETVEGGSEQKRIILKIRFRG